VCSPEPAPHLRPPCTSPFLEEPMTDALTAPDLHLVDDATPAQHDIADAMSAFAVLRAENSRLLSALAASLKIAATDFRALFHIASTDQVTPKHIAEHLGLTTGAMTALVDRIEGAGLAQRVPNPSDRRSLLVELTDAGRAAVDQGGSIYSSAFGASIPAADVAAVTRAFTELAAQLGRAADRLG
jgi:DNA-binding MarR family transcriptional regulator